MKSKQVKKQNINNDTLEVDKYTKEKYTHPHTNI